jgi:hypothetical protein
MGAPGWAMALLLLAAGCPGTGGSSDAALDGEEPAEDAGPTDGDAPTLDLDLGQDLGLLVPPGTRLCVLGAGRDLAAQLRLKVRVALQPGLVRLDPRQASAEVELVEALELTPGLGTPTPAGPGTFTLQETGTLLEARFEQGFLVGARSFFVAARFAYPLEGGLQTLDQTWLKARLADDPGWLRAGFVGEEELGRFYACEPERQRTNVYTFGMTDGSSLRLEEWMFEHGVELGACTADLTRATFHRGAAVQEVDDYWRTAYQPGNHNIIERFAVRFEPPLGDTHGLLVYTQSLGEPLVELATITTMDASLAPGDSLPLESASYQGTACSMQTP